MPGEIHVVVLWPRAVEHADAIFADLRERFRMLEVVRIEWEPSAFARCLSRFYEDSTMAFGSTKQEHVGTGAFLLAVVEDEGPSYERRRTTRGRAVVHAAMFDAKAEYRRLTGGGHLVHGSVTAAEGDRDLFFLLRRRASEFAHAEAWDGVVKQHRGNVLGVDGWHDRRELLLDLELSLPYVQLDAGPPLRVLLEERWWADVLTEVHGQPHGARRLTLEVGTESLDVDVSHVGDGSLGRRLQRSLLRQRVRDRSGAFVPGDEEEPSAWQRLRSALRPTSDEPSSPTPR